MASASASDSQSASQTPALDELLNSKYDYFHDDKENPYEESASPQEAAVELTAQGRLDDAVLAWEAALVRAAAAKEWDNHYSFSLELGRLLMDVNNDNLALRCFNKVIDPPVADEEEGEDASQLPPPAPAHLRRDAMLLRSVCLINEDPDPAKKVPESIKEWLSEVVPETSPAADGGTPLEERLRGWMLDDPARAGADAAVALGLVQLIGGRSTAWEPFVDALLADASVAAPGTEDPAGDADVLGCFSGPQRLSTRWNMLGAVLANKRRYEEAKAAYGHALALQPHYPRALMNCALSLDACGDHAGAARRYVEALRIVPRWAAPSFWPWLLKAARDMKDGALSDAAAKENLAQMCELLEMTTTPPLDTAPVEADQTPQLLLAQIGLHGTMYAPSGGLRAREPLSQATAPCPEEPSLGIGARVEVNGLASEAGKALNGQQGIVCAGPVSGRIGVEIEGVGRKSIKLENLTAINAS